MTIKTTRFNRARFNRVKGNLAKANPAYRELLLYLVFGVLTTAVNFVLYFVCTNVLHINYLISNTIAWVGAMLFAFVTNKIVVFEAHDNAPKNVLIELALFATARGFSFFVETLLLYTGVELVKLDDGIVKISVAVIVVIINYFLTRYIFKEGKRDQGTHTE